jgi:hypothetical protein
MTQIIVLLTLALVSLGLVARQPAPPATFAYLTTSEPGLARDLVGRLVIVVMVVTIIAALAML